MHPDHAQPSIPIGSPSPWRALLWLPAVVLGIAAVIVFLTGRKRHAKPATA